MKKKIFEMYIKNIKKEWKILLKALIIIGIIHGFTLLVADEEPVFYISKFLLFMLIISLIMPLFFILRNYWAAKNSFEYNWWDKTFKVVPEKNIKYYRDIIEVESPLLINDIYEGAATKNVVVAELISMEKRGIIRLEDDKIIVLEKNELLRSEETFLTFIENGKVKITDVNMFIKTLKAMTETDRKANENWYKTKKFSTKERIQNFLLAIVHSVIIIAFANFYVLGKDFEMFGFVWWVSMLFVLIRIEVILKSAWSTKTTLAETKEFKELKKKVFGLEKFLKEYTMLENRNSEEVEIWEEYLIYSVLFGHNEKIVKEYEKYIDFDIDLDSLKYN